jgi:hypothetical protein
MLRGDLYTLSLGIELLSENLNKSRVETSQSLTADQQLIALDLESVNFHMFPVLIEAPIHLQFPSKSSRLKTFDCLEEEKAGTYWEYSNPTVSDAHIARVLIKETNDQKLFNLRPRLRMVRSLSLNIGCPVIV